MEHSFEVLVILRGTYCQCHTVQYPIYSSDSPIVMWGHLNITGGGIMGSALDLLLEPQLVVDLLLDELKIISSHALIVPFKDGHFFL